MDKNEISVKLAYNKKQNNIYIPNEIFRDLSKCEELKNAQVPFAYCFYYLITWLYQYAKYSHVCVDTKTIKEILGYKDNNRKITPVITENGILDQLGYTETSRDYPMVVELDEYDQLKFTLFSDFENEGFDVPVMSAKGKNSKFKVPLKAFHRYDNEVEDGTFYDVSNTHSVPFELFMEFMTDKEMGCGGFYVYSFLVYKNQILDTAYKNSVRRIAESIGMSSSQVGRYIKKLEQRKLIHRIEGFTSRVDNEFSRVADSYEVK